MKPFPIMNDDDLNKAFLVVEELWGAEEGTEKRATFDIMVTLIEAYEAKHHAIPLGDPIKVIEYKLKELGLSRSSLARKLGWNRGRVTEVLNGKRGLTLSMVQQLAAVLEIPPGLLVGKERSPVGDTDNVVQLSAATFALAASSARAAGCTLTDYVEAAVRQYLPPDSAAPSRTRTITIISQDRQSIFSWPRHSEMALPSMQGEGRLVA